MLCFALFEYLYYLRHCVLLSSNDVGGLGACFTTASCDSADIPLILDNDHLGTVAVEEAVCGKENLYFMM